MRTEQSQGNGKIHSIQEALDLLNAAAEDSADKVRGLFTNDYQNLKRILAEAKPEVKAAASGLKQVTFETVISAKNKAVTATQEAARRVDQSARENAWAYIGIAAAASSIVGFILGRKSLCSKE